MSDNKNNILSFTTHSRVAYFTMEIALHHEIHTYSGGLGVLAGDTIRSGTNLGINMVAVSLVSQFGYFRQEIDAEGQQVEHPDPWEPSLWAQPLDAKITVPIDGRDIWVGGWLYILEDELGAAQPVLLLDTDQYENRPDDREITHYLYGKDPEYRFKQEIVLGIGGFKMLQALGFRIKHYHMNEGHSALLAMELMRENVYPADNLKPGESPYKLTAIRKMCSFTTHTPIEAGHDKFSYDLYNALLGDYFDLNLLKSLAGENELNMTRLALNLSEKINGVTKKHAEHSRQMFPGYRIRDITNGVNPHTWTSPPFADLFDRHIPGWRHEPELLIRADCVIPPDEIWQAHCNAKASMINMVLTRTGVRLNPDLPTIGFARRMTAYKRPQLLFKDLEKLKSIAVEHPFQIVMAGKAHPQDEPGKKLIALIHKTIHDLNPDISVVFIPNYNIEIAAFLVSGVDLWLNTPLRPLEASGTSGMKAAFNGVPSLSVLDGWWLEGCIENVTGWAIGDNDESRNGFDAESLYQKLEDVILPLYASDRSAWIEVMAQAICKNASQFNSHDMMRRYVVEAYSQ